MALKLTGGHTGSVLCVDVQKDSLNIVSGGEGGELCVWSPDGTLKHRHIQSDNDCTSVCFSTEKEDLVYAAFNNKVQIFDIKNFSTPIETYEFNEEEINQIVLNDKEKFLASCDDSGEIKIIDLQEKRLYKTLRHKHTNICATACFRPRKPWEIITGGLDSKLIHWDFSRPKCLNQYNMQELQTSQSDVDSYMVNPPLVHHLAASTDGHYLVGALENGLLAVFDISRKHLKEVCSLHAHSQGASQVHFLKESKFISGGNDCCVILWDLEHSAEQENYGQNGSNNEASLQTNGSTRPQERRNENFSQVCKKQEIQHSNKINWMKPFVKNEQQMLVIADQTSELSILALP